MYNNLKDLRISYPFLPVETAPAWFGSIKFMRVVVTLPAKEPLDLQKNGDYIKATLTTLAGNLAIVHVECAAYGSWGMDANDQPVLTPWSANIAIPVFIGVMPYGISYIYADSQIPTIQGASWRIHPSCLVFQQEAPKVSIETSGSAPAVELTYSDGDISQWIVADIIEDITDGILWLDNGHNIEVSGSSKSVLFTGAAGAGTGTWSESPCDDSSTTFDHVRGKALRSINGKTGNVLINGEQSVKITDHQLASYNAVEISLGNS